LNTIHKTSNNAITCIVDIDNEAETPGLFPGVTGSFGSGNRSQFSIPYGKEQSSVRYEKMYLKLRELYLNADKIGINVKPMTAHVSKIPFTVSANGFSSNASGPREYEDDLLELDVYTEYTFVTIGTQSK